MLGGLAPEVNSAQWSVTGGYRWNQQAREAKHTPELLTGGTMSDDPVGQSVFPIASWEIGPLSDHDAIVIRAELVDVLTGQTSSTPFIALHRSQVQLFLEDIAKALAKLEAVQATPDGKKLQ